MKAFLSRHKRTILALTTAFFYSVAITYATPPASQYNPAETLDPTCVPGDTNCSVSLYPDQTGNSGAFLTTNGTAVSWATIPASSNIYNADGTLSANRTLTLSGNSLDIAGTTTTRFFANGNVGIGTTTDSGFSLDVAGDIRGGDRLYIGPLPENYAPARINISSFVTKNSFANSVMTLSSTETGGGGIYPTQLVFAQEGVTGWSWQSVNQGVAFSNLMFNPNGGNVLVGTTTNAGYKFDVNGTGRFTGILNTDSSLSVGQNARIRFAENDGWGYLGQAFGWYYQGGATFPFKISDASLLVGWNTLGGNYGTGNLFVNGNTILGSSFDSGSYKLDVIGDVRIRPGSATLVIEDIAGTYTRLSNGGGTSFVEFGTNDAYFHQGDINFSNASGAVKFYGGVKIGSSSSPHASAVLDISSISKGVLLSRMTSAERTTITTPATGLLVYQTDTTEGQYVKLSGSWQRFLTTADIGTTITSDNIYNANGSLTGARTLTLSGNTLDIAGSSIKTRFASNGYVGIGFANYSPQFPYALDVNGSIQVATGQYILSPAVYIDSINPRTTDVVVNNISGTQIAKFFGATQNVSIGNTNDAGYKLDVNGTGRFTSGVFTTSVDTNDLGTPLSVKAGVYNLYDVGSEILKRYNSNGFLIRQSLFGSVNYGIFVDTGGPSYLTGGRQYIHFTLNEGIRITNNDATYPASIPSALFAINSTSQGFLTPRMTNAQRTAITTPATGLLAYSTDATEGLYVNTSGGWQRFLTSGDTLSNIYTADGSLTGARTLTLNANSLDIAGTTTTRFFANGNVGIGTTTDAGYKLDVNGTARIQGDLALPTSRINASGAGGAYAIAIGTSITATAGGDNAISIGAGAASPGVDGISIGVYSTAGNSSLAMGRGANAANNGAIALGYASVANDNEIVMGSSYIPYSDIYFGSGRTRNDIAGAGQAFTINGSGAFGTDQVGGNISLVGGKGTGTGTGGDIIFSTSTALGSGTTLQSLSERMRVKYNTGNILIGTSTDAGYKLDVNGTVRALSNMRISNGVSGGYLDILPSDTQVALGAIYNAGAIPIRSYSTIYVGPNGDNSTYISSGLLTAPVLKSKEVGGTEINIQASATYGAIDVVKPTVADYPLVLGRYANVLIGTTTDSGHKFQVTGTVALSSLTVASSSQDALCIVNAGTEVQRNNGAQTCTVSSARFKHDIEPLSGDILGTLTKFTPSTFIYNDQTNTRIGLIAEEVATIDPRLVFYEADGTTPRGVRYEDLSILTLQGVKDISITLTTLTDLTIPNTLRTTLTAWLGDVGNGITTLFAKKVETEELCVKKSNGGSVCVTGDQLEQLLTQPASVQTVVETSVVPEIVPTDPVPSEEEITEEVLDEETPVVIPEEVTLPTSDEVIP